MTYYEEFGLDPRATPEEIRQAYRNLSRLLHPDQQSDEALQRLAETQMKRLNSIHGILSDPAKRRQYDLSLSEEMKTGRRIARLEVAMERGWAL